MVQGHLQGVPLLEAQEGQEEGEEEMKVHKLTKKSRWFLPRIVACGYYADTLRTHRKWAFVTCKTCIKKKPKARKK